MVLVALPAMKTTAAAPAMPASLCRATLQADLDAGGELYLPAGQYKIDQPLIASTGHVHGDGDSTEIFNVLGGSVLQIRDKPNPTSPTVFQSSPWSDLLPGAILTVDVANPQWGPDQTFICGTMYNQLPGPWLLMAVNGGTQLALLYRTADGQQHVNYMPMQFPASIPIPDGLYHCDARNFEVNPALQFTTLALPWIKLLTPLHAYSTAGHAWGDPVPVLPVGPFYLGDVKLRSATKYGQVLSLGPAEEEIQVERVRTVGGAQGIGTLDYGVVYPVHLRDCVMSWSAHCGIYLSGATAPLESPTIEYAGECAGIFKGSDVSVRDGFVSDSATVVDVWRMLDARGNGGVYVFDNCEMDFEGGSPQSYFNCERHANTPKTSLSVQNCSVGKLGGPAHVVLRESELGGAKGLCRSNIQDDLTVQKSASWS